MSKTQDLYREAKQVIPGGVQLLSKRPEMFLPGAWPAYFQKAKGYRVWDLDDRCYIDMSFMGIGACPLGYANQAVDDAVKGVIDQGSMSTLNPPEEVELAQAMCRIHPWAAMCRFARTGGEAMSMAVRIARAKAGRDGVLFCGYHGWHDWYLSANLGDEKGLDGHLIPGLQPVGVPRALKGLAMPFEYNNTDQFKKLIQTQSKSAGVIVMEAVRNYIPSPDFVNAVREEANRHGMILIVDEITSGFRLNRGGAHLKYGLTPDIAVFAKGISNGYPMAVVMGSRGAMDAAQDSFISSTYWTERIGPTAALKTITIMDQESTHEQLQKNGNIVKGIWERSAAKAGIEIEIAGIDPLGRFGFKHPEPLVLKTLFTQEMLKRGILATTAFYASSAHDAEAFDLYETAVNEVFMQIAKGISNGKYREMLEGDPCQSGFKRMT